MKLSELENLQQLLNNGSMYSHFMDFCNFVHGDFAIIDNLSKMIIMNHSALQAINMSHDEIIGHDYSSYRSKVVHLAPDFFNRDQSCRSKKIEILTISWAQYGQNNQ